MRTIITSVALVLLLFGVPSAAYAGHTALLLHADGTDGSVTFLDSSANGHTVTVQGNAQIDTADYKFATGAVLLDGTGDSLSLPAGHAEWAFGTGDFTIDAWIKTSDSTGTFFCWRPADDYGWGGNWFYWRWSGATQYFSVGIDNSSTWSSSTSTTVHTGNWVHLAFTRASGTVRAFVDGVQIVSGTANVNIVSTSSRGDNEPNFGGANNCGSDVQASMDEIRIIKGEAAWTSNFTPPDAPYEQVSTVFTDDVLVTGSTTVHGSVSKGSGTFMIDHPLDPKNKLLYHSFVESPEARNVYEGLALLDESGTATVELPEYFLALNRELRYFASAVGEAMPDLHLRYGVRKKYWLWGPPVFTIAGGTPFGEVSWQVNGVRHDAYMRDHPVRTEVDKGSGELFDVGECVFAPLCNK